MIAHELGVVLTEGPGGRPGAGIGCVRTASPLPDVPETLSNSRAIDRSLRMEMAAFEEIPVRLRVTRGRFPFGLGRQTSPGPAGKGIGFIKAHVANRLRLVDLTETSQRV